MLWVIQADLLKVILVDIQLDPISTSIDGLSWGGGGGGGAGGAGYNLTPYNPPSDNPKYHMPSTNCRAEMEHLIQNLVPLF